MPIDIDPQYLVEKPATSAQTDSGSAINIDPQYLVTDSPYSEAKAGSAIRQEVPQAAAEKSIGTKLQDLAAVAKNGLLAQAEGAYTGALRLGSTLAKSLGKTSRDIIEPAVKGTKLENFNKDNPYITPEKIQAHYEDQEKLLQSYKDRGYSTLPGELVGMIAPTAMIPSAGVAGWGLGGALTKGANLASQIAAKTSLSALGGAADVGAYGALTNFPGNDPNSVINEEGLSSGMKAGLLAGPIAGKLGEYGANITAYKNAIPGYKGKVINADLKEGIDTFINDKILNYLPGFFGTSGVRNQIQQDMPKHIVDWAKGISKKTTDQSVQSIGYNIAKSKASFDKEFRMVGNEFNNAAKDVQVTFDNGTKMSIPEARALKQDLYMQSQKLQNQYATPETQKAVNDLIEKYRAIDGNISNALKGNNSLMKKWEEVKLFTNVRDEVFNPQKQKDLVNAIKSVNKDKEDLYNFIDKVIKTKSPDKLKQRMGMFGQEGQKDIENIVIQKALKSSWDFNQGTINVPNFLKQLETAPNANILISPETKSTLNGFVKLYQKNEQQIANRFAAQNSGNNVVGTGFNAALLGAGYTSLTSGNVAPIVGLAATPAVLSKVISSSPLKNMLMLIDKGVGKVSDNPNFSEYLFKKAGDYINRIAGQEIGNSRKPKSKDSSETRVPVKIMGVRG